MRVPNRFRRSLDRVFSSSLEKGDELSLANISEDDKTSALYGFIQLALWLLTLPTIAFLLLWIMQK